MNSTVGHHRAVKSGSCRDGRWIRPNKATAAARMQRFLKGSRSLGALKGQSENLNCKGRRKADVKRKKRERRKKSLVAEQIVPTSLGAFRIITGEKPLCSTRPSHLSSQLLCTQWCLKGPLEPADRAGREGIVSGQVSSPS